MGDDYLEKSLKSFATILIFAIINIIIYIVFHRNEPFTMYTISSTFAFSTLVLIFLWLVKTCGLIIAIILLFGLAFVLDYVIKLPFTDEAYNPFFGAIGLIILIVSFIRGIVNFINYRLVSSNDY